MLNKPIIILLLGKNGMLGQEIVYQIKRQNHEAHFKLVAVDKNELDITKRAQVVQAINTIKPNIVINCAAYTNVDKAEEEYNTAFKVNADAVKYVAKTCELIGANLIHFSTDYVFDGTQLDGYKEDCVKHRKPLNVYGASKLQAEKNIASQMSSAKYFIIRTSWLYGKAGDNFVDSMLRRAVDSQKNVHSQNNAKSFKVVNDQFGNPTYTVDLAKTVLWIVRNQVKLDSGIYHCTNNVFKLETESAKTSKSASTGKSPAGISWYIFTKEIFKQAFKLGVLSSLPKVEPCSSAEFPSIAKRPKYSSLINTKLPEMMPKWKDALGEYLSSNSNKTFNHTH